MNAVAERIAEAPGTTLAPAERAVLALRSAEAEKELKALAAKNKDITAVTNKDGRDQAHAACMSLRGARVEIERRGKEARDDATKFSKAVIAEEKRLVGLIEPEETRLRKLRDDWDAAQERIKQAAIEAERQRVTALQKKIAFVASYPGRYAGQSASLLELAIAEAECVEFDEAEFGEWITTARAAKETALDQLRKMHADRMELEAEQERQRLEAEAEKARMAEEAARLAKEREEQQRQVAELERLRREQEAREREAREKIEQQEREARQRIEAEARAQREAIEAAEAARRAEAAARQAELDKQAAAIAEREAALAKATAPAPASAPDAAPSYPGLSLLADGIAAHFMIDHDDAIRWIEEAAKELA